MTYKLTSSTSIIRLADGAYIPADPLNRDYAEYQAWLAAGNTPEPADPPTQAELQTSLTSAVQAHLDAKAQGNGYDNIMSACSYAGAANPYQSESAAYVGWRGNVWAHCYQVLTDVQAGNRPVPTAAALIAELPVLVLP